MEWTLGGAAIALLVVGLVGQGFEMRRINAEGVDEEEGRPSAFADRRNFKWYAIIGAGIAIWFAAERL